MLEIKRRDPRAEVEDFVSFEIKDSAKFLGDMRGGFSLAAFAGIGDPPSWCEVYETSLADMTMFMTDVRLTAIGVSLMAPQDPLPLAQTLRWSMRLGEAMLFSDKLASIKFRTDFLEPPSIAYGQRFAMDLRLDDIVSGDIAVPCTIRLSIFNRWG